jgi:hypothetical protein
MDARNALIEIAKSSNIEFVDSSNVVFFMKAKDKGFLYVGFEGSSGITEETDCSIIDYYGKETWEARVYCYKNVSDKQIEGMKIANSKGEFVWEEFIYPNQPFQFLGQLDIDGSTSKASIWVHD